MVALFSILLLIPFGFSIYNYITLKDCQSKGSNGCPSVYTYGFEGIHNIIDPTLDPKTNQVVLK